MMSDDPRRRDLAYSELDRDMTVWAHVQNGRVTALGRGQDGYERTEQLWDPRDESQGTAYYHPDHGWTNAATGRAIEKQQDWEAER